MARGGCHILKVMNQPKRLVMTFFTTLETTTLLELHEQKTGPRTKCVVLRWIICLFHGKRSQIPHHYSPVRIAGGRRFSFRPPRTASQPRRALGTAAAQFCALRDCSDTPYIVGYFFSKVKCTVSTAIQ
jgi:hypothetical protein